MLELGRDSRLVGPISSGMANDYIIRVHPTGGYAAIAARPAQRDWYDDPEPDPDQRAFPTLDAATEWVKHTTGMYDHAYIHPECYPDPPAGFWDRGEPWRYTLDAEFRDAAATAIADGDLPTDHYEDCYCVWCTRWQTEHERENSETYWRTRIANEVTTAFTDGINPGLFTRDLTDMFTELILTPDAGAND